MESKGVIFKVLPATSGTSQRTGNQWMAQQFVLEVSSGDHGQYKRKQVFEVFGEDRIKQFQLFEGKSCVVYFDLEAREHEKKWYNSARVYNIQEIVPQGQQQVQSQTQYRPQQPQPQYRPQQPNTGYFQPMPPGYQQQGGYYQPTQQPPQQQFPPNVDPVTGDALPF